MLTAAAIAKAEPRPRMWRLSDGGGLYLQINPNGQRWWRFRYRFGNKQKQLSLGVYPKVTLADARRAHRAACELLEANTDPSGERKAATAKRRTDAAMARNTFGDLVEAWRAAKRADIAPTTSEKEQSFINRYLKTSLYPLPVKDVNAPRIVAALQPLIGAKKYETAQALKRIIGLTLRYGIAIGVAERDWSRDISEAVPARIKRNHAALTKPKDVGALLRAIHANSRSGPVLAAALQLLPYVFVRPGELRGTRWQEIDWNAALWIIPAHRMKGKINERREHVVPLSKQALKILKRQQGMTGGGEFVFPGAWDSSISISESSLNRMLINLGYPRKVQTPHGFRTTASTLLNEHVQWKGKTGDHVEAQLAHLTPGVRGVYNKALYLDQRREMMQKWADYLDTIMSAGPR